MLLSIIVPLFNAEQTLAECVNSVLCDNSPDYELILVNDGSVDASARICDAFAAQDTRVVVIHQENQGLACARNAGLRKASGDYVAHLDSDDFLLAGWLSKIRGETRAYPDAEAFVWHINQLIDGKVIPETTLFPATTNPIMTGSEAFRLLFCTNLGIFWHSVRYVVRRTCILERDLFYRPGVMHEDLDFNPLMVSKLNGVHLCNSSYYVYRKGHETASTAKYTFRRCVDMLAITDRWDKYLQTCSLDEASVQGFRAVLARLLWDAVASMPSFSAGERDLLYRNARLQTRLLKEVREPPLSACGKRMLLAVSGLKGAAWTLARRRGRRTV